MSIEFLAIFEVPVNLTKINNFKLSSHLGLVPYSIVEAAWPERSYGRPRAWTYGEEL